MKTAKVAAFGALVAFAWLGSSSLPASAQIQPMARPRFGFVQLMTGFRPDPVIMNGQMGGNVPASQFGGNCRGSVFAQPSHIVRSQTGFRRIRFVVNGSGADSTLMVMLPNGQVICDDDGGGNYNPLVETTAGPGDIRVWVGVYSDSAQNRPYTMGVTELPHITWQNLGAGGVAPPPPPVARGINPNAPPAYGTVQLRAGFMPDPHVVSGLAGGPLQASQADANCRGYITPNPSHVLSSPTGFRTLRIAANAAGLDSTLIVMLPNGQILCDDDGGSSMQPIVTANGVPPGPVRVWVGSYSQGGNGPYNLGFSELASLGTANIPAPGGVVRPQVPPQPPVQPPPPAGEVVPMQPGIPVTLFGPGMDANTIALWRPSGATPVRVTYSNRVIMAGSVQIASIPATMQDPIVTVVQQRNGQLVARAEQPPSGGRDRGQAVVYLVRFEGQPVVANQWSGTAVQRGPRWSR